MNVPSAPKPHVAIGLIGDFDAAVTAHRAIPIALALAGEALGFEVRPEWLHTIGLKPQPDPGLARFDGLWCVPASPYANAAGAIAAIRFARTSGLPFLGTCGGFQHALLEYAAAFWGIERPAHAEIEPDAADPVIAPLACSLVEQQGRIVFAPGSRIQRLYEAPETVEGYHCRYGLNPRYAGRLSEGPLRATGWSDDGEVRAVELDGHPFYLATLFQPERAALATRVPPLARGFVAAAARRSG